MASSARSWAQVGYSRTLCSHRSWPSKRDATRPFSRGAVPASWHHPAPTLTAIHVTAPTNRALRCTPRLLGPVPDLESHVGPPSMRAAGCSRPRKGLRAAGAGNAIAGEEPAAIIPEAELEISDRAESAAPGEYAA